MTNEELLDLERQATKEWIVAQEELGIDILVDGEMYRGDMATYFAENMEGFAISGLVRSYGNRYYRKPVAIAEVRRPESITVDWWRYAQSLTDKPVKGMLTGPYTMADWSFNDYYRDREAFILAMAEVIHQEAKDLDDAGCKYIQIDEPAFSTRLDEIEVFIKAMGIVTKGLKAYTLTHICYGDFAKVYPRMLDIPVDQIDLELANSGYDLIDLFRKHPFTKDIGLGVVDVHTHVIEPVAQVKDNIRRALEVMRPEQIYVDPDCGLKTRTPEEAKAKLQVVRQATDEVKRELSLA
jgi:5-methyltetrahydropteroyltriglutamate--homocysteine methyltransferase